MSKLDIVSLIENDTSTRLKNNYKNNLLTKIQNTFEEKEQQLFVASFYCYLKYNSTKDFVIDFKDVWKWCGFTRKDNVMLDVKTKHIQQRILEIYPEADNDYLLILMLLRVYKHSKPNTLERNFLLEGINLLWK